MGRAVFVDFTADWCLTCKVNERVVLDVEEILEAFEQRGVTLLRADWTRRDPEITAALESFAWSGVPLYVLYPADLWAPARVLPVILTKRIVLEALAALEGLSEAVRVVLSSFTGTGPGTGLVFSLSFPLSSFPLSLVFLPA